MTKVMHIITGMTFGGAQKFLINLVTAHKELGIDSMVVGLYPGPLGARLHEIGVEYHEYNFTRKYDLRIIPSLISLIRQWKPDVVHTHLGTADFYGKLSAKISGVKSIVSTAHNEEDWKEDFLLNAMDIFAASMADIHVACARPVYSSIQRTYGKVSRVHLIENGIDPHIKILRSSDEIRRGLSIDSKKKLIVCIGRMERQKNQALLLHALAHINRDDICCCLIGAGSQAQEMIQLKSILGIPGPIKWIEKTPDPYSYIAAADVIVLPSLWEGLPIVLLESMALRKIIVASDIIAHINIIENEYNGLLFTSNDYIELAHILTHALRLDSKEREKIASNAAHTVAQKYNINIAARKYAKLYREQ